MSSWRSCPNQSAILLVDIQEKLIPVVSDHQELLKRLNLLLEAAGHFSVPVFISEQVPEKLGRTVPEVLSKIEPAAIFSKTRFSAKDELEPGMEIRNWFLCGIEAHICVRQTAFDLKEQGVHVSLLADVVSSRKKFDCDVAIEEMRASGIRIMTLESLLFEWLESSSNDQFRKISKGVREL